MSVIRFLDTNILIYAYDLDSPAKRKVALSLVQQGLTIPGETAISVQVLQEMQVNLVKKGIPLIKANQIIRDFTDWTVVDNTLDLFRAALDEQVRWKISLWDALIVAAARSVGASELISEDFNHGQNYDGIRAVNPFL